MWICMFVKPLSAVIGILIAASAAPRISARPVVVVPTTIHAQLVEPVAGDRLIVRRRLQIA